MRGFDSIDKLSLEQCQQIIQGDIDSQYHDALQKRIDELQKKETNTFTPDLFADIVFKPASTCPPDFSFLVTVPVFLFLLTVIVGGLCFMCDELGAAIAILAVFVIVIIILIIHNVDVKSTYLNNVEYVEYGEFLNGTQRIAKDGKIGLKYGDYKILLCSKYNNISVFEGTLLLIGLNDKCGIYDLVKKDFILSPKYDKISKIEDGFLQVELDGKKGIFSLNSSTMIVPVKYNDVAKFDENHYLIQEGVNYGIFSKRIFKTIVPTKYDSIDPFSNQMCAAHKGELVNHYDIYGNFLR